MDGQPYRPSSPWWGCGGWLRLLNHQHTRSDSDPIDALAIARAALREPDLPVATLDGQFREVRLWWITTGTRS